MGLYYAFEWFHRNLGSKFVLDADPDVARLAARYGIPQENFLVYDNDMDGSLSYHDMTSFPAHSQPHYQQRRHQSSPVPAAAGSRKGLLLLRAVGHTAALVGVGLVGYMIGARGAKRG